MKRRIFVLSCASFLASCAATPGTLTFAPNSTLILTRHADRDGEDLNAKGLQRAAALVTALDGIPLDGIYAPGIKRNLDTAAPLAQARGLSVKRIPQESPTGPLLRAGAGKTVIWVGNKGNLTTIWQDLGLPEPIPLDYGDLVLIQSDASGRITLDRRRYGPS